MVIFADSSTFLFCIAASKFVLASFHMLASVVCNKSPLNVQSSQLTQLAQSSRISQLYPWFCKPLNCEESGHVVCVWFLNIPAGQSACCSWVTTLLTSSAG